MVVADRRRRRRPGPAASCWAAAWARTDRPGIAARSGPTAVWTAGGAATAGQPRQQGEVHAFFVSSKAACYRRLFRKESLAGAASQHQPHVALQFRAGFVETSLPGADQRLPTSSCNWSRCSVSWQTGAGLAGSPSVAGLVTARKPAPRHPATQRGARTWPRRSAPSQRNDGGNSEKPCRRVFVWRMAAACAIVPQRALARQHIGVSNAHPAGWTAGGLVSIGDRAMPSSTAHH